LNPNLGAAHNDLGIMLYKQRDLNGAVAEYRETIRLLPDYAEAHNNLGNALREMGNLDDAIAEYRKALVIRSDYSEGHNTSESRSQPGETGESHRRISQGGGSEFVLHCSALQPGRRVRGEEQFERGYC